MDEDAPDGAEGAAESADVASADLEDDVPVVLVEATQEDGTVQKIVFTSGDTVDVYELERLCQKVGTKASASLSRRALWETAEEFGGTGVGCVLQGAVGLNVWIGSANSAFCNSGFLSASVRCEPLQVGWPQRPPQKVAAALTNSYLVATLHLHTIAPGGADQPGVWVPTRKLISHKYTLRNLQGCDVGGGLWN